MSRIHIVLLIVAAVMLSGVAAMAATPAPQDGLPPELIIAPNPPLTQQLQLLQGLRTYTEAHKPSAGGGLLSGLKGMFGGGAAKAVPVPADAVALHAEAWRGRPVVVTGVYQEKSKDIGLLPYEGGALRISMPAGVLQEGLGQAGPNGLPVAIEGTVEPTALGGQVRATLVQPSDWLTLLRIGRVYEMLGQPEQALETYEQAFNRAQAQRSPFAAYAKATSGRLTYELRDVKRARRHFSSAWNPFTGVDRQGQPKHMTWIPREDGSGWDKVSMSEAIGPPLNRLNETDFWYRFMDFFVTLAGGQYWLGIIFLAVVSRVVIWPLTKKQFASAEAMKRLQPQIKALQEKYVEDKQQFQTEFWRLCQANGVNPLGGCLPMLVQMPVLIFLWKGIQNYIVEFNGHGFLWVKNLAGPDMGLLVAYTLSMILFQKMTQKLQPAPTMSAQQAQQQQMMTYMMPLMFFFFFKDFPAAFLLYWLATNVVYFVQQYLYTRGVAKAGDPAVVDGPPQSTGGFAGTMAKMMSMKTTTEQQPPAAEPKQSFHEKQAATQGKKVAKGAEKTSNKRGRKH